jgi:copper transport protein
MMCKLVKVSGITVILTGLLIGVLAGILLSVPSSVDSHAYLDRSDPVQESELKHSPTEIKVQFTEPIDTRVSQLRLENEVGEVMDGELYGTDELTLVLDIPPLEDGVYTVYWQVLALDTHITDGQFRFAVGTELPADQPAETITIGGSQEEDQDLQGEQDAGWIPMFRTMENVTLIMIAGWFVFRTWLWKQEGDQWLTSPPQNKRFERRLYGIALLVFLLTGAGHVFSRASQLTESWSDPLLWDTALIISSSTIVGVVSWLRPLLVGTLIVVTLGDKQRVLWKSLLLIGLLITFAYAGHAYHSSMLLSHSVHFGAVIVWLAGIVGFTAYSFRLKKQAAALAFMHERLVSFSTLALITVLLVTATGILLGIVHIGSWPNLTDTAYGRILLWKIAFFIMAVIVATFHRFVWLPNLQKVHASEEKNKQLTYLFWGLRIELLLLFVTVVLAGLLSSASPPERYDDRQHEHDHHQSMPMAEKKKFYVR